MPKRLENGSPRTALEWYLKNMVGRTFAFDLPLVGKKTFAPKAGHFMRFVCETPKSGRRKGWVEGASSPLDARRKILSGEVGADEISGYVVSRAMSLPLIPEILEHWDAVLREKAKPDFLLFVKKFAARDGDYNLVVMEANADGVTIGPLSAYRRRLSDGLMKKIGLVAIAGDEASGLLPDNSANGKLELGARGAEDLSPKNYANTIAQSGENVNTPEEGPRFSVGGEPVRQVAFGEKYPALARAVERARRTTEAARRIHAGREHQQAHAAAVAARIAAAAILKNPGVSREELAHGVREACRALDLDAQRIPDIVAQAERTLKREQAASRAGRPLPEHDRLVEAVGAQAYAENAEALGSLVK